MISFYESLRFYLYYDFLHTEVTLVRIMQIELTRLRYTTLTNMRMDNYLPLLLTKFKQVYGKKISFKLQIVENVLLHGSNYNSFDPIALKVLINDPLSVLYVS